MKLTDNVSQMKPLPERNVQCKLVQGVVFGKMSYNL